MLASLFGYGIALSSVVLISRTSVPSSHLRSPSSLALSHAVSSSAVVPSLSLLFAGAQPSLSPFTCQIAIPLILIPLRRSASPVTTSYADAHPFPLSIGFSC